MTEQALAVIWGANVKAARIAHNATQKELADACGVAQHTISRIENGVHRPNDALRIEIAYAVGKDVEDLFPHKTVARNEELRRRRQAAGRLGAAVTNSRYSGSRQTEAAREAQFEKWMNKVDPDKKLSIPERTRRAQSAQKAHLLRLAEKAAEARRRNREAVTA